MIHVPRRLDLIRSLPGKSLIGAEVGVMNGDFSAEILTLPNIQRLYLIDPWLHQPGDYEKDPANVDQGGQDARCNAVCDRFRDDPRVAIWRTMSLDAAQTFFDFFHASRVTGHTSLSFAYLDARHDYDSVLADLRAWSRVAPVLFVHDFDDNDRAVHMGFAVVRAVHDFCASNGWHVTAVTDSDEWSTCELRQITATG